MSRLSLLLVLAITVWSQPTNTLAQPGEISRYRVELRNGRLTVRARDAAMQSVLEEIARQSGLRLLVREPLAGRVTIELVELDFADALRRLLHGMSYALQYVPGEAGVGSVKTLWVLAAGSPNPARPADGQIEEAAEADDSTEHATALRLAAVAALAENDLVLPDATLAVAIGDESAAVRYEAAYALGEIGDEGSLHLLEQALWDADTRVRSAAAHALVDIGGERSAILLASVLNDPDPAVREDAVYAVAEIGGEAAVRLLEQASADSDEYVREAATDLLRELRARD